MAARLNRLDTERVLARIKLSQLTNRLQDNALGLLKSPNTGEPVSMNDGQIQSAKFLLERMLARAVAPQDLNLHGDLSLTVVTGVPDKPIKP